MGLMNKINKMKSFLFDEEDEETPKKSSKKTVKIEEKEVVKKEPVKKEEEKIEELYFEEEKEKSVLTNTASLKPRASKIEEKFKFPEFDDDDFAVASKKPEPIIPIKKEEPKRTLYQGSRRKEETKKFKPSPIISPIYGLLDSHGNLVKEEKESGKISNYKEEKTFDEVRKKAYGKLDEELENTIKRLSKKTIEEAENDMKNEKLSRQKKHGDQKTEITLANGQSTSLDDEEDDDMILPNVNFKEIDVDKEKEKVKSPKKSQKQKVNIEDDDDDTKEQDLFNLIDTMYQNKEED